MNISTHSMLQYCQKGQLCNLLISMILDTEMGGFVHILFSCPRRKNNLLCPSEKKNPQSAVAKTNQFLVMLRGHKCWILASICEVGRLNVLCHLINFTLSSAFLCLILLSKA